MTRIKVEDLQSDLGFGARIDGVDWSNIFDAGLWSEIAQLFDDRGLLLFENMDPTSKMQVELSRIFGPLKDHPTQSTPREDVSDESALGVIDMHYVPLDDPEDDVLVRRDGRLLARFSPWHFDHCYNDKLNRAGVLRAPVYPPDSGRTGFADGVELYSSFPKELRDRLEGQNIIYTLDTRLSSMRFGVDFESISEAAITDSILEEAAIFPRAMHPAVWTRESGEKVLHVGLWMSAGMEHHEDPEGDAFFGEVCETIIELCKGSATYWHDWCPTDMVVWDNWRMLHAVEGWDPRYERRTLRTTIEGDYGLGHFEAGGKIGAVRRELA